MARYSELFLLLCLFYFILSLLIWLVLLLSCWRWCAVAHQPSVGVALLPSLFKQDCPHKRTHTGLTHIFLVSAVHRCVHAPSYPDISTIHLPSFSTPGKGLRPSSHGDSPWQRQQHRYSLSCGSCGRARTGGATEVSDSGLELTEPGLAFPSEEPRLHHTPHTGAWPKSSTRPQKPQSSASSLSWQ